MCKQNVTEPLLLDNAEGSTMIPSLVYTHAALYNAKSKMWEQAYNGIMLHL